MERVVIIGAGPCGLGAAYRLNELGHTDYTVYERNAHVGGLAASFQDAAGYTWDFAVHVAHSHYDYVDRLMDSLLPNGFYYHERRSWIREYGRYIPYPFQNNVRHLPKEALWECIEGLLDLQPARETDAPPPAHFKDWVLRGFGAGIAKHFMLPYNRKIWSTDPAEMGYQWIGDRVPQIDLKRILRNVILEQDDVSWGPNHMFQFPKEGGTGAIWRALAKRLPPERVRLSTELVEIDARNRTLLFADGTRDRYDHLVSTIPIPRLTAMVAQEPLDRLASRLQYTHVQVVCVAAPTPIPADLAQKTWIYVPETDHIFYRVTPFSTFSPAHVPDLAKSCSFLCEISTPGAGSPHAEGEAVTRTLQGLRDSGLLPDLPSDPHVHYLDAEFGYPVPTVDRDTILHELLPALATHGIYSRGRFGAWKYEAANMDHSIMQGVEAVNRILNGAEEITWARPGVVNNKGRRRKPET